MGGREEKPGTVQFTWKPGGTATSLETVPWDSASFMTVVAMNTVTALPQAPNQGSCPSPELVPWTSDRRGRSGVGGRGA